jgi:o-succinylbenzoate synthase
LAVTERAILRSRQQELELAAPLRNARAEWRSRRTLIVEIHDGVGHVGQGEAAPLPGYSRDTLAMAELALAAIPAAELQGVLQLEQPVALLSAAAALVPAELPSARFALETALLDRLGQMQQRPLWSVLGALLPAAALPASELALCVLLSSADPELALREAVQHFRLGVRCFKLKIGPERLQPAQARLLAALRAELGDDITLRLDANQSLLRAELRATFDALARYRPEFVEEPVSEPRLGELDALSCGWALDESLQRSEPERVEALSSTPACRALVLKPTALGGFSRCLELATRARALGKGVVVSHMFEGPSGWLACAHLAIALGSGPAAGLWPMAGRGVCPAVVHAGKLQAPQHPGLGVGP